MSPVVGVVPESWWRSHEMFMVSVNHLVLLQLCPFSDSKSRASLLNGAWGILELLSFDWIPVVSLLQYIYVHDTVVDSNL